MRPAVEKTTGREGQHSNDNREDNNMIHTKRVVDGVVVDIPEGVEYVEPEVRELARGIAADIRERGHLQLSRPCKSGQVCIVSSPTYQANKQAFDARRRLARLLCGTPTDPIGVGDWNDSTPTAVVLARLDAIAEGLVAS